jgi:drug/metabolite transporter (DMT)-like permease
MSARAWALFAGMSLVWGIPYLFIKVAVDGGIPPAFIAWVYVNPVVAVFLGVLILDERPGAGAVAGLLLILAGSWLSTDGRIPPGLARRLSRRRSGGRSPLAHEG